MNAVQSGSNRYYPEKLLDVARNTGLLKEISCWEEIAFIICVKWKFIVDVAR